MRRTPERATAAGGCTASAIMPACLIVSQHMCRFVTYVQRSGGSVHCETNMGHTASLNLTSLAP